MTQGFLKFLEEHERKLEDLITEDVSQDTEDFIEDAYEEPVKPVRKVIPKQVPKTQPKVVKESSVPFSFCSSCGQKLTANINGKFCPFCGKSTLMSTAGNNKVVTKKNRISEDVDYASNLLSDDSMEHSRMCEYLERNPVKNPITEVLKGNQNIGESAMDRASDLLDGSSEIGQVQLLEMPDFSKFMPPKPKEEAKQQVQEIATAPMMQPTGIDDPAVLAQMAQLGLI